MKKRLIITIYFLENNGTLYDLLINLLNENENIVDSLTMQVYLAKIIFKMKTAISEKIENITDERKKQKKDIFTAQSIVLTNLSELVVISNDIFNQFSKGNIITKNEKFFDAPKKITESVTEHKSEEKPNRSIPNWVKVSEERFNSIKQIINKNKDLGTTINNKRYILKDANDLVNKIAIKKIGENNAIKFQN